MKKKVRILNFSMFTVTINFCRDIHVHLQLSNKDAHSHFLLGFFAAGQFALLVQEVDETNQQQEQQNTHHHRYHHSAGASLLLIGCNATNQGKT